MNTVLKHVFKTLLCLSFRDKIFPTEITIEQKSCNDFDFVDIFNLEPTWYVL